MKLFHFTQKHGEIPLPVCGAVNDNGSARHLGRSDCSVPNIEKVNATARKANLTEGGEISGQLAAHQQFQTHVVLHNFGNRNCHRGFQGLRIVPLQKEGGFIVKVAFSNHRHKVCIDLPDFIFSVCAFINLDCANRYAFYSIFNRDFARYSEPLVVVANSAVLRKLRLASDDGIKPYGVLYHGNVGGVLQHHAHLRSRVRVSDAGVGKLHCAEMLRHPRRERFEYLVIAPIQIEEAFDIAPFGGVGLMSYFLLH